MRILPYLIVLVLLAGCSDYGYHPHYIISQDEQAPEPQQEEVR